MEKKLGNDFPLNASVDAFSRHKAIHRWITRSWRNDEELLAIVGMLGIDPKESCYVAIDIRLDHYASLLQRYDMESLYAAKHTLLDMCDSSFERSLSTFSADETVTVILWRDGFLRGEGLIEAIEALRSWSLQEYGIGFTVGIGTHALSPKDVPESARNARIATAYRLIFGHGENIEYESIHMRVGISVPYPKQIERELLEALRRGSRPAFELKLSAFFDVVCTGATNYALVAIHTLCMQMYRTLPEEKQADSDLAGMYAELRICEHYTEHQRLITAFGIQSMAQIQNDTNERYQELLDSMVAYVQENYPNPDLSVISIAEHAQVSQNTVRQVFRDRLNTLPRDYIIRVRMEEACRLLVQTDKTAKEIAAMVGFLESRYFYNVFKKHTNQTAFEYRIHAHQTMK